jgi:sulfide:quinone oxidoreductase
MKKRVLVLGAGFGGLEITSLLSEKLGDDVDVTLIDKNASFVFGYSKLDVMFGKETPAGARLPYEHAVKPGVRFAQQTVTAIDPHNRRVTTDQGVFEADFIVVALGADYDLDATPGLAAAGNEFYSMEGAERLRELLPEFAGGRVVVGVCGAPFKCPPAPSEAALMLHDYLSARGLRDSSEITLVIPFGRPVPPSPDTSSALLSAFAERGIRFIPERRVKALDGARRVALLDDGTELPYDLFLGVPKHRAPKAVEASGMLLNGWVPVNPRTLETHFPGVFAIGDISGTGAPKAGVFAEGAARSVATSLIAALGRGGQPEAYAGAGSCYIEFGAGRVARVDVDFFSGPKPTGRHQEASTALRAEKESFGSTRRARRFGLGAGASTSSMPVDAAAPSRAPPAPGQ